VSDVRRALEADRRRTSQRLGLLSADHADFVAASEGSNADDEHDPKGATIAFERSQVATLAAQARAHLVEVDAALARLEAGTYGRCERCGGPIPAARLAARPTATTCVRCP
jgi:DnaK suppressor protein